MAGIGCYQLSRLATDWPKRYFHEHAKMLWRPLKFSLCFVALCASSTLCPANPSCEIDEDKKRTISAVLCGQAAPEVEYRFSGPGCLVKSISKRLDDSAIQIHAFRICGEPDFSERLKEANLRAVKFMETLSTCTPEKPDIRKIMENAIINIARRVTGESCTYDLRARLSQRRPYFEKMIDLSKDTNAPAAIFEKLGVEVDGAGNIREK
jgi:hypothetical protein